MQGIVCKVCGHVALSGAAPEQCPVCASPQSAFEDKQDAIVDLADAANPTDAEKKHTPDITVVKECGLIPGECQDTHVRIGIDILHPMTDEHLINWLDYYVDEVFAGRIMLTPAANGGGALHLKPGGSKLTVVSLCNLHGTWKSEADL